MTKPNSRVKDGKASTVISAGRGAGSPTEGKPGTSTNPKTFAQVTEVKK